MAGLQLWSVFVKRGQSTPLDAATESTAGYGKQQCARMESSRSFNLRT